MDDLTQTEAAAMRGSVESITVDEIRGALRPYRVHPKEFDAWLAAHDREVAALALEDAAVEVRAEIGQAEMSLHGVSHENEIPFPTDMVLRGASLMVERIVARVATMRATPSTETNEGANRG